jgi:hypothetical protein
MVDDLRQDLESLFRKFSDEIGLLGCQFLRDFDKDADKLIPAPFSFEMRHAKALHADFSVTMGAGGDFQSLRSTVQSRHVDCRSETCLREADCFFYIQVVPVPRENGMRENIDIQEQIAGRPSIGTLKAFSGESELFAG